MHKNKVLNWCGLLMAALALIWFGSQLVKYSTVFDELSIQAIGYIVLSAATYIISAIITGTSWGLLLRGVGETRLSLNRVVSISCLAQIGKYLPGNVAHHIGRVVLAQKHNLSIYTTSFTIFIETVWVIAIAALLALVAIWAVGSSVFNEIPNLPHWWVLTVLISSAMLAPLVGHKLFDRAARWWAIRKGKKFQPVRLPSLRVFWLVGILYAANFMILGLVLQIIASYIFSAQSGNILLLSGIFAVAWIVGFITPGAPAGLGVREVVLVAALTPVYGNEPAIGIAAVLRVVTVLGDGLSFLLGICLDRISKSDVKAGF
ncbi:lysylphosphatidylglycerol synthase domain-containing protein [Thermodesulfobacteriota bacterium]